MHVTGECRACDVSYLVDSQTHIAESSLSPERQREFIDNGFFTATGVIESHIIRDARQYIDQKYKSWLKQSRRQDDWRMHYQLHFSKLQEPVEHAPVLDLLLQSPRLLQTITALLKCSPGGIFYNQVAYRTPLPADCPVKVLDYTSGAEYHIDGQANQFGTRFPDPWSLLIGVALVDLSRTDMGNFTVFPGSHTLDWSTYPQQKREKTLPDLGKPHHVALCAGDVVVCHNLLAHRGGKNTVLHTLHQENEGKRDLDLDSEGSWTSINYTGLENIPVGTREMVFFRIQRSSSVEVDPSTCDIFDPSSCDWYYTSDRSRRILFDRDIFYEYPGLQDQIIGRSVQSLDVQQCPANDS